MSEALAEWLEQAFAVAEVRKETMIGEGFLNGRMYCIALARGPQALHLHKTVVEAGKVNFEGDALPPIPDGALA